MITGIDIDQLNEDDQQYYDSIREHMRSVASELNCSFEMKFLSINQCHLIMKTDKKTICWEQITIDGIPSVLDALLRQHQERPLDIDQLETLQDAKKIEGV